MTTVQYDNTLQDTLRFMLHFNRKALSLWRGVRITLFFLVFCYLAMLLLIVLRLDFRVFDPVYTVWQDSLYAALYTGWIWFSYIFRGAGRIFLDAWYIWLPFCVFFLLSPFLNRFIYVRRVKALFAKGKNRSIFGPWTITISPEHVLVETPWIRTTVAWPAIEKVERVRDDIYIYITTASAWSVPRRAFDSEATFQAFYNECRKYVEAGEKAACSPG
ncbi:MAG: YcxB family protein [Pseudomonadota bacterium]|nr:YcxB family protein [Pseudomonadota bacterium]